MSRLTALAAPLTAMVLLVQTPTAVEPVPAPVENAPPVEADGHAVFTPEQQQFIAWGEGRYAAAGLELPPTGSTTTPKLAGGVAARTARPAASWRSAP